MERIVTKQMKFGRSCAKCKAYFVTNDQEARLCPWCEKVESGYSQAEAYEFPEE
jgi:rRNA maturation endonuclease Nob1